MSRYDIAFACIHYPKSPLTTQNKCQVHMGNSNVFSIRVHFHVQSQNLAIYEGANRLESSDETGYADVENFPFQYSCWFQRPDQNKWGTMAGSRGSFWLMLVVTTTVTK